MVGVGYHMAVLIYKTLSRVTGDLLLIDHIVCKFAELLRCLERLPFIV